MSSPYLKTLEQGEVLFAKDQAITQFFLIRSGELGLFWEKENHLVPYKKVSAQEFVGEGFLFSERGWPWTAIVLSPELEFLPLEKKEIHASLKTCPNWVESLITVLCERLADTEDIILEHNIKDDELENSFQISEKHENLFWRKLSEFRQGLDS